MRTQLLPHHAALYPSGLRGLIRNQLSFARAGSNPAGVVYVLARFPSEPMFTCQRSLARNYIQGSPATVLQLPAICFGWSIRRGTGWLRRISTSDDLRLNANLI